MTLERDEAQSVPREKPRDPCATLRGCQRILILGRTGSGKTTLARAGRSHRRAPRGPRRAVLRPGIQHGAAARATRADDRRDRGGATG